MNILAWLLRLLFFLAVLWFALKNTMPVTVRLTETLRWDDVPLVLVMLGCLLLGALALAPRLYRLQRRALTADAGLRQVGVGPAADAEAGGDSLAQVARRAGAVGEFELTETGSATTRR